MEHPFSKLSVAHNFAQPHVNIRIKLNPDRQSSGALSRPVSHWRASEGQPMPFARIPLVYPQPQIEQACEPWVRPGSDRWLRVTSRCARALCFIIFGLAPGHGPREQSKHAFRGEIHTRLVCTSAAWERFLHDRSPRSVLTLTSHS